MIHTIKQLVSFDNSGYDNNPTLREVFESEYSWVIERKEYRQALKEWLQGLPSCLDFPFYNFDIVSKVNNGDTNISDDSFYYIVDSYWDTLPLVVLGMMADQEEQLEEEL